MGGVFACFATPSRYEDDFTRGRRRREHQRTVQRDSEHEALAAERVRIRLGRYVGGLVPDVAFQSDGSISTIGTTSWVGGVEQRVTNKVSLGGYYSGVNTDDTFYLDTGSSYIGFGYPGASNSNNRSIQEVTGTGFYQFLSSTDRGSGQFSVQMSWLTREPWSQGTDRRRPRPSCSSHRFATTYPEDPSTSAVQLSLDSSGCPGPTHV